MNFEWNSIISAIVGGLLALSGTWITLRIKTKEKKESECRELIPLFFF